MTDRTAPDLDFETFKSWAREAFTTASKIKFFPFDTVFDMHVHMVGEDDLFTDKVNEAIPFFIKKLQTEGIKIPHGDIAVVSVVRKAKAYDIEVDDEGIWTMDRVREVPPDHPIVKDIQSWVTNFDEMMKSVRQWFVIARFQAKRSVQAPLFMLVFGYVGFSDDRKMGGVCPISPSMEAVLGASSPEEAHEMELSFGYECCETLRQIAAIAYLEEKNG